MAKPRVLYITNNHPTLSVGGVEVYSYDLYRGMRATGAFEPIFLARTHDSSYPPRDATPFYGVEDDPDLVLWSVPDYDYFLMTSPRKAQYTVHLRALLETYRPDLVHVQHTVGLGIDLLRQIRRSLPGAPIVYTLHEFLPICHAQGHMLRTGGKELCTHASPARCHGCFPEISPRQFLKRERFIRSHLRLVDLFLCPSRFLLERYAEWGIPRAKLRFHDYGREHPAPLEAPDTPPLGAFGFFGQISRDKGILVLLEAMRRLAERGNAGAELHISGGNLDQQTPAFRERFATRLEKCGDRVRFRGRYYSAEELRLRMRDVAWVVVPSIWWENSPLVIQEAFLYGRPVICSDVGGMAEKVTDGVDGLHFRVGDAADLAAKLERASGSPELWRTLRAGIKPIFSLEAALDELGEIYRSLLRRSRGGARRTRASDGAETRKSPAGAGLSLARKG